MDTQAYVSTRTHEHPHAHRHITRHMNTCLHTLVHTHTCTQRYLYLHMNTHLCMWNTSMHTNVYHQTDRNTCNYSHACTHMYTQHTCTCNTDTPSHTCTHTMHACKTHPCTHAHTCTGMAGAGMHNTLPRTSEEEEEGRHIILFPPVQMTSLSWHQLCFDRFVIFLEHEDMGLKPSPQFHRWERRFLAMNLLEQNDITTEELGGPRRARCICSTPGPRRRREAAQRRERHWTETSLCVRRLGHSFAGGTWSIGSPSLVPSAVTSEGSGITEGDIVELSSGHTARTRVVVPTRDPLPQGSPM